MYLAVDETVLGLGGQVVLVDEVLGNEPEGDPHVLVSVQRCIQLEILDVNRHVLRVGCAEHTVPQDFGCDQVRCVGGEFAWVSIRFPPTVIRTRLGSAFCGL